MGVVVPIDGGNEAKASVKPLVELTSQDMILVNKLILSKTGSEVTMIPEVAQHLIDSGGKRLRPMLTLAAARMCGYGDDASATKGEEHHITLAASDCITGAPASSANAGIWSNRSLHAHQAGCKRFRG